MYKPPPGETAFDIVVRVLAPALGANMARSIARGQWDKLGIVGDALSERQLTELTEALRPGLNVFVGRGNTDQVLAQLRDDFTRTRGGPGRG